MGLIKSSSGTTYIDDNDSTTQHQLMVVVGKTHEPKHDLNPKSSAANYPKCCAIAVHASTFIANVSRRSAASRIRRCVQAFNARIRATSMRPIR